MKSLWPLVAAAVLVAGMTAGLSFLYVLGSIVGSILEWCLRAVWGALCHLPGTLSSLLTWLWSSLLVLVSNPLGTLCTIAGMLLVLTYFRGIAGHFQERGPLFRGSSVRSAEDIFPDFRNELPKSPSIRGSSLGNTDSLFEEPIQPMWRRLWDRIKELTTRRLGGDDLL